MSKKQTFSTLRSAALAIIVLFTLSAAASAATLRIENVTRIKGQEVTTIRGYGMISGLNGTGDDMKSYGPAARTAIRILELSGIPGTTLREMASSKNNALVEVTATISETGGRDGDRIDCTVTSVGNAKSLENGVLSATMLTDPLPKNQEMAEALGLAFGKITVEKAGGPLVGKIKKGCRLTGDFINPYIDQGNVTLVVRQEYSDPRMAYYVAEAINNEPLFAGGVPIAKAINSHFVVVKVPKAYFGNPMQFVAALMDVEVLMAKPLKPRVVINERAGIISIDDAVEVKPSLITHRLITAEIRPPVPAGEQEIFPNQFIDVDTELKHLQFLGENVQNQKLKSLQSSLDALRVPPQDIIEIIKILERQGAIVGDVVYVDAE